MAAQDFGETFPAPLPGETGSSTPKQLEVYAVFEDDAWLAITVIVKFF